MNYEFEIELLKRQVKQLRKDSIQYNMFIDTISSPLWKRIIWWFEGFYFRKVGRWYKKDWMPKWPK